MKIFLKDNYFHNADELRDIALSLTDYRHHTNYDNHPLGKVGWRGLRSNPLEDYNLNVLNETTKKIFNDILDFYNDDDKDLAITTFFHIISNKDKKTFRCKYHDDGIPYAGVVYLNPFPVSECGTSVLDEENNKLLHVTNVYNRAIAYQNGTIHAPTGAFGDDKETARLTYLFFIHKKCDKYLIAR